MEAIVRAVCRAENVFVFNRAKDIDGGRLAIAITGTGRTVEAIQRMIPAHAQEINGLHGWRSPALSEFDRG